MVALFRVAGVMATLHGNPVTWRQSSPGRLTHEECMKCRDGNGSPLHVIVDIISVYMLIY